MSWNVGWIWSCGWSGRPAHPGPANSPRNHPLRRDELHPIAGPDHLPATLMHQAVMVVAKGKEVGQRIGERLDSCPELTCKSIFTQTLPWDAQSQLHSPFTVVF